MLLLLDGATDCVIHTVFQGLNKIAHLENAPAGD